MWWNLEAMRGRVQKHSEELRCVQPSLSVPLATVESSVFLFLGGSSPLLLYVCPSHSVSASLSLPPSLPRSLELPTPPPPTPETVSGLRGSRWESVPPEDTDHKLLVAPWQTHVCYCGNMVFMDAVVQSFGIYWHLKIGTCQFLYTVQENMKGENLMWFNL